MTEKELIRRALMGDKQAQELCTAKGIALPCPFCGKEMREHKTRKWTATKDEPINRTVVEHQAKTGCYLDNWAFDKELDLESWNARPAPPIGRCRECKHLVLCDRYGKCNSGNLYAVRYDSFCCYFEPREEE